MTDIVFIQNKDSHSWAVKDNTTGDTKGLIVERGCMEQDETPYFIYDVVFINQSLFWSEFIAHSDSDLSAVQEWLLHYLNNEAL
jgi:hypothetical protein